MSGGEQTASGNRDVPWPQHRPPVVVKALLLSLLSVVALIGAGGIPPPSSINADTAWLIEVIERAREGAAPYRDILETNPPVSLLLYWPAVTLGALTGLGSEMAVYAFVLAFGAASIWLCVRLRETSFGEPGWMRLALLCVVLMVLPGATFSQREHLAVLGLAPVLMLQMECMLRPDRRAPLPLRSIAGVMSGLAVAIKPHFALAMILPAIVIAVRHKKAGHLFSAEYMVAMVVSTGLLVISFMAFPEFLRTTWPLVKDGYLQARLPLAAMLFIEPGQLVLGTVLVLMLAVALLGRWYPHLLISLAMSCGFALAFLIQGKGFGYHALPIVLVACLGLLSPVENRAHGLVLLLLGACVSLVAAVIFSQAPSEPGLRRDVDRLSKGRNGVIIISPSTHVSFPLVRELGLRWRASTCCAWIASTPHALFDPDLSEAALSAASPRAVRLRQAEADRFARDISASSPDLIVFDTNLFDMHARLISFSQFREAMRRYEPAGHSAEGRFRYFLRR